MEEMPISVLRRTKSQKGYLYLDSIVAFTVLTIGIISMAMVLSSMTKSVSRSQERWEQYAEQRMEAVEMILEVGGEEGSDDL
jgi:type II secretory pathway component PulJ